MLMLVFYFFYIYIYKYIIYTPIGRKGIRFQFRNPAAEPHKIRALVRVLVGVTQNDLETPSGDPERVFFSV